jgi:hypothetical protein
MAAVPEILMGALAEELDPPPPTEAEELSPPPPQATKTAAAAGSSINLIVCFNMNDLSGVKILIGLFCSSFLILVSYFCW